MDAIMKNESLSDVERESCPIHNKDRKYICFTCAAFICLKCGQTNHVSHTWKEVCEVIKDLTRLKEDSEKIRLHNQVQLAITRRQLDKVRENVKNTIDAVVERTKEEYEGHVTNKYQRHLEDCEKDIAKAVLSLQTFIFYPEEFFKSGNSSVQYKLEEEIKDLSHQNVLNENKDLSILHQSSGCDDGKISKMCVGTVIDFQKTKLIQLTSFHMKDVTQIIALDDSLAWIGSCGEKEIKLVDIDGKIKTTHKISVPVDCFAFSKIDEICFIPANSKSIENEDIPCKKKVNLSAYPTSISATSSELLITSISDLENPCGQVLRGTTWSSKAFVPMSIQDQKLTCPMKAIYSPTGDLCILNKTSKESNKRELRVIRKDGATITIFRDKEALEISDIAYDVYGNIICSVYDRNSIMLLSIQGDKVEIKNLRSLENPLALSVYGNLLWISTEKGTVHVHFLKYNIIEING